MWSKETVEMILFLNSSHKTTLWQTNQEKTGVKSQRLADRSEVVKILNEYKKLLCVLYW